MMSRGGECSSSDEKKPFFNPSTIYKILGDIIEMGMRSEKIIIKREKITA